MWTRLPATTVERSLVSGPDLQDYITETRLFEGFAGAAAMAGTLTGDGPPEQIMNGYTTWNLFQLLGVLSPDFRIYLPADAGMPTIIDAWGVLPSNIGEFARDAP